jgi:hypothetical protein
VTAVDWVTGDLTGMQIPAHSEALRAKGAAYLTQMFRAYGVLGTDNRVKAITECQDWSGGSTGRKLKLSVAYETPFPQLHGELFVKFSRDFADSARDQAKRQMQSEVRFAAMSRAPDFPIAVPACYFADYHAESGTGILITQRIPYGQGTTEPHYEKCRDNEMPQALEHYTLILRSVARLAGSHRGGRLHDVAAQFPFDANNMAVRESAPMSALELEQKIARYAAFAAEAPQLLPPDVTHPAFIAKLSAEAPEFLKHEAAVKQFLFTRPDLIALCHWNANIDNAFFWRNASGVLECGLMDWGHVGQMNVAMALWGCLSAAEIELWDAHIDTLLTTFLAEMRDSGGPLVEVSELKLHLNLYIALMGITWLLDVGSLIRSRIADLTSVRDRFDPKIRGHELSRVRLHMASVFLHLWRTQDFGSDLDRCLRQCGVK